MKSSLIRWFSCTAVYFIFAAMPHAAQFEARTVEQLAMAAQQITQGRVAACSAGRDAKGRIWTTYTIEVYDRLKGGDGPEGKSRPRSLTVRQLGGTVGKVTSRASGVAHFTVGEEVLLFTRDFGGGVQSVFNTPLGALRVVHDEDASSSSTSSSAAKPAARVSVAGDAEDLEQFKAGLRVILKRQQASAGKQ